MNDDTPGDKAGTNPQSDDAMGESPLVRIAYDEGDPELFPPAVLRLHADGRQAQAREALLAALRSESDPHRRERQQHWAEQLRLWFEPANGKSPGLFTLNGIGTMLYGSYQADGDGLHIATQWLVFAFIPLIPLSSWLVKPADQGGWYFLGRTPLPPLWRTWKKVVLTLMLAIAAAFAVGVGQAMIKRRTELELVIVNGFQRPVVVQVNGRRFELAPTGHRRCGSLAVRETARFTASWPGEAEPFESLTRRFDGEGGRLAVYNVKNRAPLILTEIVYGSSSVPKARVVYDPASIAIMDKPEYVFTEPPKQKRVKRGQVIRDTILMMVAPDQNVMIQAGIIQSEHVSGPMRKELAAAMLEAEQLTGPQSIDAVAMGIAAREGKPEEQIRYARDFRDQHMDDVEAHRLYQQCWESQNKAELIKEYQGLLEAHPQSAVYHYLLGRVVPDHERARELYEQALELDRGFRYPWLGLAWQHGLAGRYDLAIDALDAYVGQDWNQISSRGGDLVRYAWHAGRRDCLERYRSGLARAGEIKAEQHGPLAYSLDLIDITEGRVTPEQAWKAASDRFQSCGHPLEGLDKELRQGAYALAAGNLGGLRGALNRARRTKEASPELIRQTLLLAASFGAEDNDVRDGRAALIPTRQGLDGPTRLLMAAVSAWLNNDNHRTLMIVLLRDPFIPRGPLDLFRGDFDLTDVAAVDKVLRPHPPAIQVAGYVGAALVLQGQAKGPETSPKQAGAIKTLRERAVQRALPDELPVGFRAVKRTD